MRSLLCALLCGAANMVFVEQPVGVGFSQASGAVVYGDAMAAEDNHAFLLGSPACLPPCPPTRPEAGVLACPAGSTICFPHFGRGRSI